MVQIKRQIVSSNVRNRVTYGNNNKKTTVTVHQTGNTNRGANAAMHARLQSNGNSRSASWHYQVDDKGAIQSFEDDAQCWHAGDGRGNGNLNSIAVEICINSDGDYKKSVENGAALVKHLLDKHGLSTKDVRQHFDWSRKNCPAQIRAGKDGISWSDFIAMVNGAKIAPAPKQQTNSSSGSKSIAQMADEVIAGKHGQGNANRRKSLGISQAEYEKVRAEVNRRLGASTSFGSSRKSISQMAQEIIDGKHGNGHETRRKSLGISQSQYNKVRAEVNKRAGGGSSSSGKSISQMATEIIRGDHGQGHAARQRSLGIDNATYQKVRAEVNRRL